MSETHDVRDDGGEVVATVELDRTTKPAPPGERLLYGTVGAESLWGTPRQAIEQWLDWQEPGEFELRLPLEIEEHDTYPASAHLPSAGWLLDGIAEYTADEEVDEVWSEHLIDVLSDAEVKAAAAKLIELIAGRITYPMARSHLRSLKATMRGDGVWLLDGEPIEVTVPLTPEQQHERDRMPEHLRDRVRRVG